VSKTGLPLFRQLVKERVAEAMKGRGEIQAAPDDTARAIQEQRHKALEARIKDIRLIGDAVIAAFFAEEKPKAREAKRAEVESWLTGSLEADWAKLAGMAATLKQGPHPLTPFHWEIEFPEVFARENGGFDAIVGNPPFAGKNTIIGSTRNSYVPWLQSAHQGAHGNADIVAHFFRRTFTLIRKGGVFGLIATNTIGQGDTRETGLAAILNKDGTIIRATRRLKWPGEAAVVVSVVHLAKGIALPSILDGRSVPRISAYLVEGDLDEAPMQLSANSRKVLIGSYALGSGFVFDDIEAEKGACEPLSTMQVLISANHKNAEKVIPFIGGSEVNTSPNQTHHRFIIDFRQLPLKRDATMPSWRELNSNEETQAYRNGIVPKDYPGDVAEDWPDLLKIVKERVLPQRLAQRDANSKRKWWQFKRPNMHLYRTVGNEPFVLARSLTSAQFPCFSILKNIFIYDQTLLVFVGPVFNLLASLCSRGHETWARFMGATFKDDPRYNVQDCFETFPFSRRFEKSSVLNGAGRTYHDHRASLMVARNEGMTKTYNRFHDPAEAADDIVRLRELHAAIDRAVLEAYGWHDLAARAAPVFLHEENEDDHTYQGRLFWPSDFRDEVLARLLALNAERHAEEVRLRRCRGGDDVDTWLEELNFLLGRKENFAKGKTYELVDLEQGNDVYVILLCRKGYKFPKSVMWTKEKVLAASTR
jgi:hypothetical protein